MLSGSLDTFTVGQILSLIGSSDATGALRVWTDDDQGHVWCRNGSISFAAVGSNSSLGDLLVRSNVVSAEQWHDIETAAIPQLGIAELFDHPDVDGDRVRRLVAKQVEESVFEMDRWTTGELALDVDTVHPLASHFSYATDDLLAVVEQRRPVWAELMGVLGSIDRFVHQTPMDADDEGELSISRSQLHVLSHIDGTRSIRELARHLGTGLYLTAQIVAGLTTGGLVALSADRSARAPAGPSVPPPQPAVQQRELVSAHATSGASAPTNGASAQPTAPTEATTEAATPAGTPATEFVEPGSGPAQDLILRLLSAVKDEL